MRIAFVEDILRFSIPLGITTIAACLREAGHEAQVYVVGAKFQDTLDAIKKYEPDAVAFSVISGSQKDYYKIAAMLKDQLSVYTLWGGPHATFFPEMIELPFVDIVCIGEGEEASVEFVNEFDAHGGSLPVDIQNFWVKKDGMIHRNPVRPRIRDLDKLPWPARELYYSQFQILDRHGIKHFMAHRGCPYKCTYCFNHKYNTLYREQADDRKVIHS